MPKSPDQSAATPESPLRTALAYSRAGYSIIPIRPDGSKEPALSKWKPYQSTLASESDLRDWFANERGIGIVCGAISQLEVIDFDASGSFEGWCELVTSASPTALDNVSVIQTPRGHGRHVYLRRSQPAPNQKLAERTCVLPNGRPGKETLIETRGEGGYVLAPGSLPACHTTGGIYTHIGGVGLIELAARPFLADFDYELLLDAARALSEVAVDAAALAHEHRAGADDQRAGSDFNRRQPWTEILDRHGWVRTRGNDACAHWRRPGKDGRGSSATTGYCKSPNGDELLYVFSSNAAPFESGRAYSKFAAFTLLNHGGDFSAAAVALGRLGFGRQTATERTTANSAVAAAAPKRVVVAPYTLFPVDALPHALRELVIRSSAAIGCDSAFVALPTLCVVAAAIGNSTRIQLKRGWTEPAVLWGAIVGVSGQQKSPALEVPLRAIEGLENDAFQDHERRQRFYAAALEAYEVELRAWRNERSASAAPEKPQEPVAKRYACSDITIEAIAPLLRDQPRGLLAHRDELGGWFTGFDQYKQSRGSDVTHWLEMHGARSMTVDRKTGKDRVIRVAKAHVCVTGGIQPAVLRESLGRANFDNGLAARLLLAHPPRRPKRWTEADLAPEVEARFRRLLERLYAIELRVDAAGAPAPYLLTLSPAAKELWVAFYDQLSFEQAELDDELAAAWSKLEAYATRLAMICHLVRRESREHVEPAVVDEASMAAAIRLTNWFGNEARRVYAEFQESEDGRRIRTAVERVRRMGGRVTVRNWMRARSLDTADAARAELDDLVRAGMARWFRPPTGETGGTPSKGIELNEPLATDTTAAGDAAAGVLSVSALSEEVPRGDPWTHSHEASTELDDGFDDACAGEFVGSVADGDAELQREGESDEVPVVDLDHAHAAVGRDNADADRAPVDGLPAAGDLNGAEIPPDESDDHGQPQLRPGDSESDRAELSASAPLLERTLRECSDTSDTDKTLNGEQRAGVVSEAESAFDASAAPLSRSSSDPMPLPRGKSICPRCGGKSSFYVSKSRMWFCTACCDEARPRAGSPSTGEDGESQAGAA